MTILAVLTVMLAAAAFALGVGSLVQTQSEHAQWSRRFDTITAANVPRTSLRGRFSQILGERIDDSEWGKGFAHRLAQADLALTPSEFVVAVVGVTLVLSLAVDILFSLNVLLDLLFGALLSILLIRFFLETRQDRYLALLAAQVPDVALLISNALKAGMSAPQAFEVVASKTTRPASVEFARLVREIHLGIPVDEAMQRMMERLPGEELALLLTTINIQRQAGGNLAHALSVASTAIAMRHRVRNEISTLTAEARYTSLIILLIPIFTLALLNQMLQDPVTKQGAVTNLLSNIFGLLLMVVFIAVLGLAFFLINRISKVRV